MPHEVRAALAAWVAHALAHPGELPPGCEVVHERLVRTVGRGRLGGDLEAYIKVMSFPRARDRMRYVHRRLPALHEERMLTALRARRVAVTVPDVLAAGGRRRALLPRASVLVTRALRVAEGRATFADAARVAAGLADAGVFYPDLHADNLLLLEGGGLGLVDLQSARLAAGPLGRRRRRRMAAKLWAGAPHEDPAALVAAGLVTRDDLVSLTAAREGLARDDLRRRVLRCLDESSEFRLVRSWSGRLHARREPPPPGTAITGGRELLEAWIGDRALQVLDGSDPTTCSLFRKWWWLGGGCQLRIGSSIARGAAGEHVRVLREGHRRWQQTLTARA